MNETGHRPRSLWNAAAYTGADGAVIREAAGRSTGLTSHSLAFITHPAGTASRAHHHTVCDEVYYVAAGQGRVTVDQAECALGPGDFIQISAGQRHKVYNDGLADLELIVTCAPAYDPHEVAWDE